MNERKPTTSLAAFQGLRDAEETEARHGFRRLDADFLSTFSIVIGGAVGLTLGVVLFLAAVVVLQTSEFLWMAPTTVQRALLLVACTAAAVGVVAAVLALWRGFVVGAGVQARAVLGLGLCGLWVCTILFGMLDSGEAQRELGGSVTRPGWLAYPDLQRGDCVVDVPPTVYASTGERAYAVGCEVATTFTAREPVAGTGAEAVVEFSESRCREAATRDPDLAQHADAVMTVHPTAEAVGQGVDVVVCVIAFEADQVGPLRPPEEGESPA